MFDACRVVEGPPGAAPAGVASKLALTRTSGAEKAALAKAGPVAMSELRRNELEFHSQLLNDAKKRLTPTMGPMFSDPLRAVNKKKVAGAGSVAATPASAASAASAPAAADKAPAKRKGAAADASGADAAAAATGDAQPAKKQKAKK